MKAVRINPVYLKNETAAELVETIEFHKRMIEPVWDIVDQGGIPAESLLDIVETHFGTALEIHEFLYEREGLPVVSDSSVLDWYGEPTPLGHWDTMPYHKRQQMLTQFNDAMRGVNPEDTALD